MPGRTGVNQGMNYEACAKLVHSDSGIPIEMAWNRVNYGLAGYGLLVGGSISDPVPMSVSSVISKTCTITMDIEGGY